MTKRSIGKMLLLEIVTLGIYRLYYFIKTSREIMELDPKIKILSPAYLLAPIALIVIAAVLFLGVLVADSGSAKAACANSKLSYATSQPAVSAQDSADMHGCPSSASTILVLVFYAVILLSFIPFVMWEWSYSQGVEVITGRRLSFALSLIILLLVPDGIDILIIQDYFNKLPAKPAAAAAPPSI